MLSDLLERRLIDYLPYVVRAYAEYQAMMDGEQPEFERAWQAADGLLEDQFLMTAGNAGLSRWEKILHIVPKATDGLEDRRFRILTRLNEELPYSLSQLRNILGTLCGPGNFSAQVVEGYTLDVKLGLAAKNNYNDVAALLERVSPQNLILQISRPYNSYHELGRFTHAQLAVFSHYDLRNEVFEGGG